MTPPAGRVALVTGAGTGLGRSTAAALAAAGVHCVVVGRRAEYVEKTASELAGEPGRLIAEAADVAEAADRERIVQTCLDHFGRLDVLVNNAGTSECEPVLDYRPESWRKVVSVNLDAAFFLAQLAAEQMRHRSWGRIVNIGSVYGSLALNNRYYPHVLPQETPGGRGPVRDPAYHASKGGLRTLTRELAVAFAGWGITVNMVSPGMFPIDDRPIGVGQRKAIAEATPLGRWGRPEEIGHAVGFFVDERSSFVTGVDLVVDGGWSLW